MSRIIRTASGTALLCLLVGCIGDPSDSGDDSIVKGSVQTSSGNPLAGLSVGVEFAMPQADGTPDTTLVASGGRNMRFLFELESAGTVQLEVAGRDNRAPDVMVLDSNLVAGQHSISWNGRDALGRLLPSDLYRILLTTEQDTVEGSLTFNGDYEHENTPWLTYAVTDGDGRFRIEAEQLPNRHGQLITFRDQEGDSLGSEPLPQWIRLHVADNQGHRAHSAWFEWSEEDAARVNLVLPD